MEFVKYKVFSIMFSWNLICRYEHAATYTRANPGMSGAVCYLRLLLLLFKVIDQSLLRYDDLFTAD